MRFAGTYHPLPYLLDKISDYLPGIADKYGIWKGFDGEIYHSDNINSPIKGDQRVQFQKLRDSRSKFEWKNPNPSSSHYQFSLEDEDNLTVLYLYFPSSIDSLNDILVIHFSKNTFLKNLNLHFNGITTQEKSILSGMLSNILTVEYNNVLNERDLLLKMEAVNLKKDENIQQLKSDLISSERLYSSAIRNLLINFKNKFEEELQKEIMLDDEVIFRLAKGKYALEDIEEIISSAIFLAYNLNLSSETLTITNDFIQTKGNSHNIIKEISLSPSHDKVEILLNRYEEAALKAELKGLEVNGKNVAANLSPPVTPPAITDSIKKNRRRISFLLQQFPDRWEKIRISIRPISNIDSQNRHKSAI
ncbi:MAG: hypothetical protein WC994_01120 [Brumimicrobium sp.]